MPYVRNIHNNKLAEVVDSGRHRVTVRLADGSVEEWDIEDMEQMWPDAASQGNSPKGEGKAGPF